MGPVVHSQEVKDILKLPFQRSLADKQLESHFFRRQSISHQPQYLLLSGERLGPVAAGGMAATQSIRCLVSDASIVACP